MRIRSPSSRAGISVWCSPVDAVLAALAPLLALYLRGAQALIPWHGTEVLLYVGISFTCSLIAFAAFRIHGSIPEYLSVHDVMELAKAVLAAELMSCAIMFSVTRLDGIPRSVPTIHALILGGSLFVARLAAHFVGKNRKLAKRAEDTDAEHVILIGLNDLSALCMKFMEAFASGGQRVIALLDEDPNLTGRSLCGVRVFGPPAHLDLLIDEFAVHGVNTDRVLVGGGPESLSKEALQEIRRVCGRREVELSFVSDSFGFGSAKRARRSGNGAFPRATGPQLSTRVVCAPYFRNKRFVESALAAVLIVALLPFLALGAVLALLDVGQPILFWQRRIGLGGRPIQLFKLRTLKHAFDRNGRLVSEQERLSPVGRLLRQTRIDELPQLLSVLAGDMALIGPRPLLPEDQPADPSVRLMIRPGISGWAQVNGGTLLTPEEKETLDAWYVRHASLWLDARIMLMTIRSLIRGDRRSEDALALARRDRNVLPADTIIVSRHDKPSRSTAPADSVARADQREPSVAPSL